MKKKYNDLNFMRNIADLSDHKSVKGYDFEKDFNAKEFFDSFLHTGFQATNLGKAITIAKEIKEKKPFTILAFTGNAISSGLRDQIAYLVKNKHVDMIVTTSSGIEEDVIKSLSDFKIGSFDVPGRVLFEHGVGRIGNILVPQDRYLLFERFLNPVLQELNEEKIVTPTRIAEKLGEKTTNGFLHWAYKNKVPVYCPGIVDGAFGDISYFFRQKFDLKIDVLADHKKIIDTLLNVNETALINLGGGIAKHYALNANIFREGLSYAIYLNVAEESFGSDSGGNEEEAKTWAKIKLDAKHVKVKADFTITFPILIAAAFKD